MGLSDSVASLRGREHARRQSIIRLDKQDSFYFDCFLCEISVFSVILFWWWWLGGWGCSALLSSFLLHTLSPQVRRKTRHGAAHSAQRLWSVSFIKYAATAGTSVHIGCVCWLYRRCKFVTSSARPDRPPWRRTVCGYMRNFPNDWPNSCPNLEIFFFWLKSWKIQEYVLLQFEAIYTRPSHHKPTWNFAWFQLMN